MNDIPVIDDVIELQLDDVEKTLTKFEAYVQGRKLDEVEQSAAMAVPMFKSLTEQIKLWGGDVRELPDVEDMISQVNNFVSVINLCMNSENQGCAA